ncbi:transposase, partial [Planctomycetota bacterium]
LGNGFIHALLRKGNVHTANGIKRFVGNVIEKSKQMAANFDVRLDAGYVFGEVLDELTDQNVRFCGRIKKNSALVRLAEPHLKRPPGRPPAQGYEDVIELGQYQAEGWKHSQRLLLVVVDKPDPKTGQLELMPRFFFLVTNWPEEQRIGDTV